MPAVVTGREALWCELIGRFTPRLRGYCRSTGCSEDELDEIIWDVRDDAVAAQDIETSPDAWPILLLVARRICAARMRKWRREQPLDDSCYRIEYVSTPAPDPALSTWVVAAMDRLPDQQRSAVDYRCRWDWPYWAVAAALGTSEATARVHVARGLHAAAAAFAPASRDPARILRAE